jgi:hypothetical protein
VAFLTWHSAGATILIALVAADIAALSPRFAQWMTHVAVLVIPRSRRRDHEDEFLDHLYSLQEKGLRLTCVVVALSFFVSATRISLIEFCVEVRSGLLQTRPLVEILSSTTERLIDSIEMLAALSISVLPITLIPLLVSSGVIRLVVVGVESGALFGLALLLRKIATRTKNFIEQGSVPVLPLFTNEDCRLVSSKIGESPQTLAGWRHIPVSTFEDRQLWLEYRRAAVRVVLTDERQHRTASLLEKTGWQPVPLRGSATTCWLKAARVL